MLPRETPVPGSQVGWGKVEVPAGDRLPPSVDYIGSRLYAGERGDFPDASADQSEALIARLPAPEQKVVRAYLRHFDFFLECWNQHIRVMNAETLPLAQKLARLDLIIS